ncbi:hypothetical protein EMPS_07721 [Entomortierella parvispora]|uniref:AN1-type domain-containing protein n=1 Tax=Entomortierella parvispora TaxID=205924 RepID=A0A9P3HFF6_9FUNG|nr:hypothetical protein EMPS_07721 [Entomortierella parvispora]
MSSRTSTVRPSRTTTKSSSQLDTSSHQETISQDRCAQCKKFLSAVKAECRYCRLVYCMEHRHPETHSPQGCAVKAREQSRQQFQRDSGHILGAEAHDRGVTHRTPGWNLEASRAELHQRLNQRVQTLKETSGRAASSSSGSSTGGSTSNATSSSPSTSSGGPKKKGGKKRPAAKTWGTGGSRLGGVPGTGAGAGPKPENA